ncbi:TPA: hypothetical protein ACX6RO_001748 [Photobacterium damselae]
MSKPNDKRKGRNRALTSKEAISHFISYFTRNLAHDDERLNLLTANFESMDILNSNDLSYSLITDQEYKAWSKAWSSYQKRTLGKRSYRYFLSETENTILKQLAEHPKYKNQSGDKILAQLIMAESMRLIQED